MLVTHDLCKLIGSAVERIVIFTYRSRLRDDGAWDAAAAAVLLLRRDADPRPVDVRGKLPRFQRLSSSLLLLGVQA